MNCDATTHKELKRQCIGETRTALVKMTRCSESVAGEMGVNRSWFRTEGCVKMRGTYEEGQCGKVDWLSLWAQGITE